MAPKRPARTIRVFLRARTVPRVRCLRPEERYVGNATYHASSASQHPVILPPGRGAMQRFAGDLQQKLGGHYKLPHDLPHPLMMMLGGRLCPHFFPRLLCPTLELSLGHTFPWACLRHCPLRQSFPRWLSGLAGFTARYRLSFSFSYCWSLLPFSHITAFPSGAD